MSYIAFGTIELRERLEFDRLSRLSMAFERRAMEEGLFLRQGPYAFDPGEDITESFPPGLQDPYGRFLPYLVTESPIENTSDDLVVPNQIFADENEWQAALRKNMLRIQRMILTLMEFQEVVEITLFLSENLCHETEYKEIVTGVEQLAEIVVQHSPNIFYVPALKLVLTKEA